VTVGSFDTAIPPMYGRAVAEAIPGARLVEFAGGGHLHNVEHPGEFNAITLEWMLGHAQN
jgi:3-oxoadipate enol-lactonase/4-carboxymuconolactone decarboxylase